MISPRCSETARRDVNRPGHGHEEERPVTQASYETNYARGHEKVPTYGHGEVSTPGLI